MPDPELLAKIKENALQYTADVAHDWQDIPGAIAEASLVELVVAVVPKYGEEATIGDIAVLLGMEDVIEDFVKGDT